MASIGFVANRNLGESNLAASDRQIIDNLAGVGTTDNIQLFAGNLRRADEIGANNYSYANDIYTTSEGFVAISNGTEVTLQASNGEILDTAISENSNGIDQFQLRSTTTNNLYVPPNPLPTIIRSNTVTLENLINLNTPRLETVAGNDQGVDVGTDSINTFTGAETIINTQSLSTRINAIDSKSSLISFKKSRTPTTYQSFSTIRDIIINGSVRISNDSEIPIANTDAPGIFVQKDGILSRAFSGFDSPWTTSGSTIQALDAEKATVDSLFATDPKITISSVFSETANVTNATHKLPVEINGEVYYLLLIE